MINIGLDVYLKDCEDKLITIALSKTNGSRLAASRLLNMSERTFRRKVSQWIKDDK